MSSAANTLVNNTKWIYVSKIATQLFSVITTILVIRKLSVDVFGTFNLFQNSFVVFQIFTLSWIISVFNRYIPEIEGTGNARHLKILVKYGLLSSFALFVVFSIAVSIFWKSFLSIFNIPIYHVGVLVFLVFCTSQFLMHVSQAIIRSLLLHKSMAFIMVASSVLRTVLYLYYLPELNVKVLLLIESAYAGVASIIAAYVYKVKVSQLMKNKQPSTIEPPITLKRVKKYGLLSLFNELGAGVVGKTSDYFIVAAMSNPIQLGLYSFANSIYALVMKALPYQEIQSVLRPLFIKKYAGHYDVNEFQKLYLFMIKVALPVYGFPLVYFLIFGKHLINIVFDPKYIYAYPVTAIVLTSNILIAMFYPLTLTVQLKEKVEYLLYSKVVVVFSIVAGIIGMKYFGIIGVAAASLMGELLKNFVILFFMRNYKEIRVSMRSLIGFIPMLVAFLPFMILHNISAGVFSFASLSIIFCVYSGFVFIAAHPFNHYDELLIKKICNSSDKLNKLFYFAAKIEKRIGLRLAQQEF